MNQRTAYPTWRTLHFAYTLENLIPLLYQAGEVSQDQAKLIQKRAQEQGISLKSSQGFDFLLHLGLQRPNPAQGLDAQQLTEEVILRTVAGRFGLEYKEIDYLDLDLEVTTQTITESFARKNLLVPLRIVDGVIEFLIFHPFRPELWDDMDRVCTLPYTVFLGSRGEITRLIQDFFQFRLAIRAAENERGYAGDIGNLEGQVALGQKSEQHAQKHVSQAVDYLLQSALRERASDIHFEPKRDDTAVRFRIDGVLHNLYRLPTTVHQAMLSRVKTQSRLDIAEKRRPQDGRMQLVLNSIPTDVRVSTVPVAFGEKMVLRLLSSERTIQDVSRLGMASEQLEQYQRMSHKTQGLILVTGPTGSGKSTTLYSTMKGLARSDVNVVTVEDPIEMVVEDFNQIGIQPKVGITYDVMLRHILRQDPDIIMVGEMRDRETGQQAIQAALTGHLVLSTLHTNDAPSSLTRLVDLGLEPYLINATLLGIIAQRLVRLICPHCKTQRRLSRETLTECGLDPDQFSDLQHSWKGVGCEKCRRTGYIERSGIFEVVEMDNDLRRTLRQGGEVDEIRSMLRGKGVESLFHAGLHKVRQGQTTLEEVMRVTGGIQE